MSLFVTKVAPALAGAYIRNLFPPRKTLLQRFLEMIGGVLMVVYTAHVAAGALWALLGWALGWLGVQDISLIIQRQQADLLAAFLVGLIGMTVVEGFLVFLRRWSANPIGTPPPSA
jgi:hypothetical protein